jgi:hypothetical protein
MQMKVTKLVQSMFLGILGTCKSIETLTQESSLIIATVYLILLNECLLFVDLKGVHRFIT